MDCRGDDLKSARRGSRNKRGAKHFVSSHRCKRRTLLLPNLQCSRKERCAALFLVHPCENRISWLWYNWGSHSCNCSRNKGDEKLSLHSLRQGRLQIENKVGKIVKDEEFHHSKEDLPDQECAQSVIENAWTILLSYHLHTNMAAGMYSGLFVQERNWTCLAIALDGLVVTFG